MLKIIIERIKETSQYCTNEIRTILRDPGAILLFIVAMFAYPFLYSLGYKNEVINEIPIAVVDQDHTVSSRKISSLFDATSQLKVVCKPTSIKEAEDLFYDGKINGVILIPKDFEQKLMKTIQTDVTVYCDAGYFLLYKQVYAGAVYALTAFNTSAEVKRLLAEGKSYKQAINQQDPIKISSFNLYNPNGGYGTLIMPAVMLIIMQQTLLIGIGMLGGTIRRRNKYAHEFLQASKPLGTIPIIFGKASAYVIIYLFNALFTMVILYNMIKMPDKSGFLPTLLLLVPFLFSVSFLGLGISMFFRDRAHSLMFMVFLSPIVLFFSGISWPTSAIPKVLFYSIAQIFPTTTMIPAYIRIRVMGSNINNIRTEGLFLIIQMIVYFIFACIVTKTIVKKINKTHINL